MDRPSVVLSFAMTVDGKIASAGREPGRLAGACDLRLLHELRATADAVVTGAATIRSANPPLHPPGAASPGPIHVVITATGRLPETVYALQHTGARARVIAAPESATLPAIGGVEVWRCGETRVEPEKLLSLLGERGVRRVLVEGGGDTNGAFVTAGLVDEVYVTIAPALLGGSGAPTPVDGAGLSLSDRRRLRLVSVNRVDDELFCHYCVEEP